MNTVDVLSFISIGMMYMLGIIGIFWCWSFYSMRKSPEISQRRPNTSILAAVLCILALFTTYPTTLLFGNVSTMPVIGYLPLIITVFSWFSTIAIYHLFTYRIYMVFYDIKFLQALEDREWRHYIDPNETNWFLKHRETWGKPKRILFLLFINWCIWLCLTTVSMLLNNGKPTKIGKIGVSLSTAIPTLCDIIIYFKFPKFNDVWYITNESLYILRFELSSIFVYAMLAIILNTDKYTIEYILLPLFPAIWTFFYIYIINYYPLKKFNYPLNPCIAKKYKHNDNDHDYMMRELSSPSSMGSRSTFDDKSNDDIISIKLRIEDLLKHKHGFNQFARHLISEFSLENLLFFVETHQWLLSLLQKNKYLTLKVNDADILKTTWLFIEISESAPKSEIVEMESKDNNKDQTEKPEVTDDNLPSFNEYLQSVKIFKKYIVNNAYFCINISFDHRNKLYQQFGINDDYSIKSDEQIVEYLKEIKLSKEKLFHTFDETRSEIFKLLKFAFSRYKASDECHDFIQKLCNKQHAQPIV